MASYPWNYQSNVEAETDAQIKIIEAQARAQIKVNDAQSQNRRSEAVLKSMTDDISASSKYWRENMSTHVGHHGNSGLSDLCHEPGNYQSND